jgi:hypothetical protein
MKLIIDELKSVPGVIGAYLFNLKTGVLASNLPGLFKEEKLVSLGRMLTKMNSAGRRSFPDIVEGTLFFEESAIVLREVSGGTCLIAICDPSFNSNLLTMSINLTLEELKNSGERADPIMQPAAAAAPPPKAAVPAANQLLADGPLATLLKEMQTLLSKVLGPMAQIVFQDALAEWAACHPPTAVALPQLVELLAREIGEPGRVKSYKQLLDAHLKSDHK